MKHRVMTDKPYSVPVVPPDLRREETIRQICDALDYLDQISNDIFTRISSRVAENHSRLQAVNDRIHLAQARIDTLKGSNKATRVFSSAKYPAQAEEEAYSSVYIDAEERLRQVKHSHYKLHAKHQTVDDKVLKEKLQFYNVQLNVKRSKSQTEESHGEGLGRLPPNIPSLSSLLLFNTSENP